MYNNKIKTNMEIFSITIPMWIIWIILACLISSFINPILYFIKFELYLRNDWIEKEKRRIENPNVRPTMKDFWDEFMETFGHGWWIPVSDIFIMIYLIIYLIFRPFNSVWNKLINKIKDIKI